VDAFVFVFGLFVTLVVCGAVGAIWWAAIGDGQRDAQARAERERERHDERPLRRVA